MTSTDHKVTIRTLTSLLNGHVAAEKWLEAKITAEDLSHHCRWLLLTEEEERRQAILQGVENRLSGAEL